jgi:hypothetical protein
MFLKESLALANIFQSIQVKPYSLSKPFFSFGHRTPKGSSSQLFTIGNPTLALFLELIC